MRKEGKQMNEFNMFMILQLYTVETENNNNKKLDKQ